MPFDIALGSGANPIMLIQWFDTKVSITFAFRLPICVVHDLVGLVRSLYPSNQPKGCNVTVEGWFVLKPAFSNNLSIKGPAGPDPISCQDKSAIAISSTDRKGRPSRSIFDDPNSSVLPAG